MSDDGRGRASLGVEVWKSSQKWSAQRSAVRSIAWLGLCGTKELQQDGYKRQDDEHEQKDRSTQLCDNVRQRSPGLLSLQPSVFEPLARFRSLEIGLIRWAATCSGAPPSQHDVDAEKRNSRRYEHSVSARQLVEDDGVKSDYGAGEPELLVADN